MSSVAPFKIEPRIMVYAWALKQYDFGLGGTE